jgi:hypothetical protein
MSSVRFALPCLALISLVPLKADGVPRDGNWWRDQSQLMKVSYMLGFFDGMDLGKDFSYWGMLPGNGKLPPASANPITQVFHSYDELVSKFMSHVTSLQISDGLDTFYGDYRNRTISIHSAVWIVLNTIAGTPEIEIKKMTEGWRRQH